MFHIRFPTWSFDDLAQFELDTLEDIFKRSDWQDRALKPALSSILAPALCAVYGKRFVFTLAAILDLQPRDKAAGLEVKTMSIGSLRDLITWSTFGENENSSLFIHKGNLSPQMRKGKI